MRHLAGTLTLLATLILGAASAAQAQVSVGIQIGPPPPPRVVHTIPRRPGADYVWIDGYWYPVGHRYVWHQGYWTLPPYVGARWTAPRHEGNRYFEGYWAGDRGRIEHDHRWDHDRYRDNRDHDRSRDHH